MQTIRLDTRIGQDGILKLALPLDLADTDVEVLVVVQQVQRRSWPAGYFDRTAGSLQDDPLERPAQGEYEIRDELA
jgi:hypothetical protein